MRRRYFVRVLQPFKNFRGGHEIALEAEEFEPLAGKGVVQVMHEEHDGQRVDVDDDEGAAKAPTTTPAAETFPLDTLPDDEREALIAHRKKRDADKARADAKAVADAEKAAAAEAKRVADEAVKAKKKADDDAKAAEKAAADKAKG
ncbi:MAG TPA: hypothetical protein VGF99_15085 [Myxococcota bacterium]